MGYIEDMNRFAKAILEVMDRPKSDIMSKQVSFSGNEWLEHTQQIETIAREYNMVLMHEPRRQDCATYVPKEFAKEASLKMACERWSEYSEAR